MVVAWRMPLMLFVRYFLYDALLAQLELYMQRDYAIVLAQVFTFVFVIVLILDL